MYELSLTSVNIVIIITIIIIIIIIMVSPRWIIMVSPRDQEYWVDVQRGEGSSLDLVGNPSRDGASIKTLVWSHLKPNPQLL